LKDAVGFCGASRWRRASGPPKLDAVREEGLRARAREKIYF